MSNAEKADAAPAPVVPPKKLSASKELAKSSHPTTGNMINAAIAALNDAKGSSLQSIKKYIAGTYLVDVEKNSAHIKKYLNTAVDNRTIAQVKGRFKLATDKPTGGTKNDSKKAKVAKKVLPKKSMRGKASPKKSVVSKKPTTAKAKQSPLKKQSTIPKAKSPSKAKKSEKATVSAKVKSPKKAAVSKASRSTKK